MSSRNSRSIRSVLATAVVPGLVRALGAALMVGLTLAGLASCGPSQLALDYDLYKAEIEPLLEQESERWNRIAKLNQARVDDYANAKFFGYIENTAVPYYTEFRVAVQAIEPADERLAKAHESLEEYADARLEFVHVTSQSRDVYERAASQDDLVQVTSRLQLAEELRLTYLNQLDGDAPDPKLAELASVVNPFIERYFVPMQQNTIDPGEVQVRLRSHVIPALEELGRRKYHDDPTNRMLKQCVAAWVSWHKLLERVCPTMQEVFQARNNSEAAMATADEAYKQLREDLERIRRER